MTGRLLFKVLCAVTVMCGWVVVDTTAEPLKLILPTRNQALYGNDGPGFYQYTNRNYKGVRSFPWEGGQYGFVRNGKETEGSVIYTRFHEGIDIRPLYLDEKGEPLDTIMSIDQGRVVYVNRLARRSNYGKYVVVEHKWEGSPFYSLYAHMGDVSVYEGQRVYQGQSLGQMGYTGTGITRARAHVHFEINMLLNQGFNDWYSDRNGDDNPHANFNGLNLAGINVADLYLAMKRNPWLTISDFVSKQEVFFKVTVPNRMPLDLLYRYPWLARDGYNAGAPSVEIGFTQSGVPVSVDNSFRRVVAPSVSMVRPSMVNLNYMTNQLVGGVDRFDTRLTGKGQRYLQLVTYPSDQSIARQMPERRRPSRSVPDKQYVWPPVVLGADRVDSFVLRKVVYQGPTSFEQITKTHAKKSKQRNPSKEW